ncbi:transmembrane protein PVRIG isoform X1 [Callithrix jacchus]|uniref:transmembrane protein PVRIG isoform X1 n=1 Tax=Callithrix jacchus TaxID=9483 RepID=UPI0023DD27D3|nr:transmembrane protein PVRIG isoform X1 [Callithrix jacchus]
MKTSCDENRGPGALQPPEPGLEGAMGRQTLALPWVLLTLCVTEGTPEVWVQVQMEATELSSFIVHCGFLGSGSISLVTVSWGGPDGAGGTRLAVLHPELGTRQWAPAHQARWETQSSISLVLEEPGASSPSANTTFCCKFASFPEGSWEACGSLPPSSDPGLSAPILRADLAGILGVSGVLLFGCGYLLHLLCRQKHWPVPRFQPPHTSPQAWRSRAWAPSQASQDALHVPCTTINTSFCPATLDTAHPHGGPSWWGSIPTHTAHRSQAPAAWASTAFPACGSFVSVENGLYAQAGERPPHTCPGLTLFPDTRGPRAMEGGLGVL